MAPLSYKIFSRKVANSMTETPHCSVRSSDDLLTRVFFNFSFWLCLPPFLVLLSLPILIILF